MALFVLALAVAGAGGVLCGGDSLADAVKLVAIGSLFVLVGWTAAA